MSRVVSAMVFNWLSATESFADFLYKEDERLQTISTGYDISHEEVGRAIDVFASQFVKEEEVDCLRTKDGVTHKEIATIANKVLLRFRCWFIEKVKMEFDAVLQRQVEVSDLLQYNDKGNSLIEEWWVVEGAQFYKDFEAAPIPYTFLGLANLIRHCETFAYCQDIMDADSLLFHTSELFHADWKAIAETTPCIEDTVYSQWFNSRPKININPAQMSIELVGDTGIRWGIDDRRFGTVADNIIGWDPAKVVWREQIETRGYCVAQLSTNRSNNPKAGDGEAVRQGSRCA